MIRDRTMRAFSLLVLVSGSAASVGAAGAEWSAAPSHHVQHARAGIATPTTAATAARRGSFVAAQATTPKRAAKHVPRLPSDLPRSLPATMLPAGSRLPTPAAPPGDPWAVRQPTRLGQIVIPSIGLDQPFFEGVDQAAFAHGVGHWPGTAGPGGWGNAVFGGHRVTEAHPFLEMDKLRAGDEVELVMSNGWTYVYRVTKVFVVPQTAMWITDQSPGRTLTLFTCHPKGSATERLITNGVLSRVVAAA
jgi:LPXTG-site transpeptidase (sortase) family protein